MKPALPSPPQSSGTPQRRRLASAIEDYLDGKIDNRGLDDAYVETWSSKDELCVRVGGAMWQFYDDLSRHRNEGRHRIVPQAEAMIRRWVVLLRSASDWEWDRGDSLRWVRDLAILLRLVRKTAPNPFWPFEEESAYKEWRERHAVQ